MLSSTLNALLKLSKTTSPKKLFDYDCITLHETSHKFTILNAKKGEQDFLTTGFGE